jgi:hypothetical protein
MTRTVATTLKAAAFALGLVSLAGPALAGGSISLNISGNGGESEDFIRTGLGIYALINEIEGNGGITQIGNGNSAGVRQGGRGNFGVVHQEGNGHNGTLTQNGNDNTYGLFQFGEGTDAHINQFGNGGSGATFVFGF